MEIVAVILVWIILVVLTGKLATRGVRGYNDHYTAHIGIPMIVVISIGFTVLYTFGVVMLCIELI